MNFYPHHIGDFDAATRHLNRIERSVYLDLLFRYYDTEQPLTLDRAALCRRVLAHSDEERAAVEAVLAEFFRHTPDGWRHDRCDAEIAAYHRRASAARQNGRRGGRPPNENPEKPTGFPPGSISDATGIPAETNQQANQEPLTKNQDLTPLTPLAGGGLGETSASSPQDGQAQRRPKFDPAAIDLPVCVDREAWVRWIKYRRSRGLTVIEQTMRAQAKKLSDMHTAGFDPAQVLDHCIQQGWQGIYEPKGGTRHDARAERQQNDAEFIATLCGRPRAGFVGRDVVQSPDGDLWVESGGQLVPGG